MTFQQIE